MTPLSKIERHFFPLYLSYRLSSVVERVAFNHKARGSTPLVGIFYEKIEAVRPRSMCYPTNDFCVK